MRKRLWLIGLFAVPALIAFVALGGGIVMWLWNWLAPSLFGWPVVTWWQAIGLLALCRILFGGVGVRGPRGPQMALRTRFHERFADRVADRWDRMTPEERERFRQRLKERCGPGFAS